MDEGWLQGLKGVVIAPVAYFKRVLSLFPDCW